MAPRTLSCLKRLSAESAGATVQSRCRRRSPALLEVAAEKSADAKVWGFSRSTAYRMIKAKMGEAKVTGGMAMPKGLRHGLAIACISANIPLSTIRKWLGHARLDTTAIYLDVLGEEERELANRLWNS